MNADNEIKIIFFSSRDEFRSRKRIFKDFVLAFVVSKQGFVLFQAKIMIYIHIKWTFPFFFMKLRAIILWFILIVSQLLYAKNVNPSEVYYIKNNYSAVPIYKEYLQDSLLIPGVTECTKSIFTVVRLNLNLFNVRNHTIILQSIVCFFFVRV